MAFHELSDPEAVKNAIAEYDQLGSDEFLKSHGYRPAKSYFLRYNEKLYDSKAIAGVAHGYQFPQEGALRPAQFSGGDATVKQKLEDLGFEIEVRRHRNPSWVTEELILALDLYLRRWPQIEKTDSELIELSALLNRLPIHPDHLGDTEFRNVNGVHMKFANFAHLDPAYPGQGLARGNQLEAVIWEQYGKDPEGLRKAVEAIKFHADTDGDWREAVVDGEEDIGAKEGRLLFRAHRSRERSSTLVRKKKSQVFKAIGKLACEVCDFDFQRQYGGLNEPFIECHHLVPLSELRPNQVTRLKDLALVCANCHRMLHRMEDPSDIGTLRESVKVHYPQAKGSLL